MKKKTKAGRPKTDNPRNYRVTILLTKGEYDQLQARVKPPLEMAQYVRHLVETDPKRVALLKEVMQWHSDPDSPEYNKCDTEPCQWCELAKSVT